MPVPGLTEIATTTLRSRAMPDKEPTTKAEQRGVMRNEMKKFGEGKLHSGSKSGPVVTNPKQAIAIGLSVSGQSTPERGARDGENPVRNPVGGDGTNPQERLDRGTSHKFDRPPSKPSHGYGHPAPVRSGHLRNSGHAGAHRIGGKRGK